MNHIIKKDAKYIIDCIGHDINKFSGKKILLTGGTGLIGQSFLALFAYLNDYYFKSKCSVVSLQRNFKKIKWSKEYLVYRDDIKFVDYDVSKKYQDDINYDFIIHAAGMSAPTFFKSNPTGTIDVNVDGIRWILDLSTKCKPESVLYMSSGDVYGDPTIVEFDETYTGNVRLDVERSCYMESKRLAETLCHIYFNKYSVPVKIARPFALFDPGMNYKNDRRVICDFINMALEDGYITVSGGGKNIRSYTYIADATVAFIKIMLSNYNDEAFNIANPNSIVSINKLAKTIHNTFNIKSPVIYSNKKMSADSPNNVIPSIDKIKKMLNFSPSISLEKGIERMTYLEPILQKDV